MRHISLFTGIGGFELAAQTVWGDDYEPVLFCEMDKFCQKVLKKHWPDVPITEDVRNVKREACPCEKCPARGKCNTCNKLFDWRESGRIDLLTGGFPCQPFSAAGKRDGVNDNRHLWPEMLRVIRAFKPAWVVAENVRGLLSIEDGVVFEQVCADLEDSGYEVQPFVIPAVAVDAHHRRDRVWFVANCKSERAGRLQDQGPTKRTRLRDELSRKRGGISRGDASNTKRQRGCSGNTKWENAEDAGQLQGSAGHGPWNPEPNVGRVANGVPNRVDRLKCLGNAIVPQVAEQIFRAIKETHEDTTFVLESGDND